jgi:hypothetical protein
MARPKTKAELQAQSQNNYQKLMAYIEGLAEEVQQGEFPPQYMNRHISDVLAHLHHWHLMFLQWYEVGMQGKKPEMPAPGYSWKTTPELNRKIWEQYQHTSLQKARELLEGSTQQVHALIDKHSDEELFTKKQYQWTGSTSLGAYLISATSSHYDWALKLIKKYVKSLP